MLHANALGHSSSIRSQNQHRRNEQTPADAARHPPLGHLQRSIILELTAQIPDNIPGTVLGTGSAAATPRLGICSCHLFMLLCKFFIFNITASARSGLFLDCMFWCHLLHFVTPGNTLYSAMEIQWYSDSVKHPYHNNQTAKKECSLLFFGPQILCRFGDYLQTVFIYRVMIYIL